MQRKNWSRLLIAAMILLIIAGATTAFLKFMPTDAGKQADHTHTMGTVKTEKQHVLSSSNQSNTDMRFPALPTPTPVPTKTVPTPITVATTAPTSAPTSNNTSWSLILNDNFSGSQLGPAWGTYDGPHTGAQSYYKPQEVQVSNGMLHIFIEQKNTNGMPYTSGGLAAFGLTQTYGKYEISARLPLGKGLDPYAILWPKDNAPNSAQVDIFESPAPTKNKVLFTNHGADGSSSVLTASGDFAAGFHTYTCEWIPGQIRFLVDGIVQGTITQSVFTQPMWFGMAISSGDGLTGLPDSSTVLPVSMDVAWVHIYKYNG